MRYVDFMVSGGDRVHQDIAGQVGLPELAALERALSGVLALDLDAFEPAAVGEFTASLERQCRRADAARVEAAGACFRKSSHRAAGYRSRNAFLRAIAGVSKGEATARTKAAATLLHMPDCRTAFRNGDIGMAHIKSISRGHGNARIRDDIEGLDARLAELAKVGEPDEFGLDVLALTRLLDADGAYTEVERAEEDRDASMLQNYDGSWTVLAQLGQATGALAHQIWQAKVEELFQADWAMAKAAHENDGAPPPSVELLDRTHAQRRADAFSELVFADANGGTGPNVVANIVIDEQSFNEAVADTFGDTAESAGSDGAGAGGCPDSGDRPGAGDADQSKRGRWRPPDVPPDELATTPLTYGRYSKTLDGRPIHPRQVVLLALLGHVRRIVVDGAGTVIDCGRKRRLYTGSARDAALISAAASGIHSCAFAGCSVPLTRCDIDHVDEHHSGGDTNQVNALPLCGQHNRHKHRSGRASAAPPG